MGLRTLMAVATMAAGVVLVGWGAVGIAALTSPTEQSGEPSRHEAPEAAIGPVPSRPVATSRIVVAAQEPTAPAAGRPEIYGWHPSLLNPEPIAPPQAPQAVAPPVMTPSAATTAEPRAEAPRGPGGERKAKRRPDNFDGRLTVAQIAQIKRRLKLTPEQEQNWRPVEAALHEMARKQAQTGRKITLSALEMQNLYFAAGPLVMSLRDDQKQEARNLARAMGLETVAELI